MTNDITFAKQPGSKPMLIAGPCSAESEEQVLNIASALANKEVNIFRAGLWKPRTRPGSFEGVGIKGLTWLQTVKREYGLPVAVEVANAHHVEQCLKHNIDVLWIGARSTVNPFTVQEIADAIKGTGIPVMIKNPINPDIELWIGAIERIIASGSTNITAIHRGFSSHEKSKYRNRPMWDIPIELKRRLPDLPIICDPSHICGRRDGLQQVSQKAIDLNFDGLMIETHNNPKKALSDSQQQITPNQLFNLLENLIIRVPNTNNTLINSVFDELREQVDDLDMELMETLKKRMDIVEKIAEYKKENNITIFQSKRWEEIMATRISTATEVGLSVGFVTKILKDIHQESIRKQTRVMNMKKKEEVI